MKNAFAVLILVTSFQSAYAACTGTQIEKMIDKAFTTSEIKELCLGNSSAPAKQPETKQPEAKQPEAKPDENVVKAEAEAPTSAACQFTSGPKAGKVQIIPTGTGVSPAPIGTPCSDGVSSCGLTVVDKKR